MLHPLETHYDPVMDEPQPSYQGSTLSNLLSQTSFAPLTLPM